MSPKISIVIPTLNEADQLVERLKHLQTYRADCEVLLVDGGSRDSTPIMAEAWVDKVIVCAPGRAKQMNVGAEQSHAEVLLFLHADTQLPDNATGLIVQAIQTGYLWGRLDVAFDRTKSIFKLIAYMTKLRSRLTGIATGDQAMFVNRQVFYQVKGFPEIALMEDIALSKRLKKIGTPCCLKAKAITSARRWEKHGLFKTIFLMWTLRLAYFLGADPEDLAIRYYGRT